MVSFELPLLSYNLQAFQRTTPPAAAPLPKTLTKKRGEFAEKMRGNSSVILRRLLVRRQVLNPNSTNIAKSLISPSANNTTVTKIPSFRNYIAASSSQSQSQMLPSLQFHRTLFSSPDGTLLFLLFFLKNNYIYLFVTRSMIVIWYFRSIKCSRHRVRGRVQ